MMVSLSMAKATRLLHLRTLLSLSRMLGKNWQDVTRSDVDELVYKIMKKYSNGDGQETNTSSDHKKILKIFFRWFKLGFRDFNEVRDPGFEKLFTSYYNRSKLLEHSCNLFLLRQTYFCILANLLVTFCTHIYKFSSPYD